jgi:hypothetical protein
VGEPPTVMDCASCYWRCELGSAMGGSLARCVVQPAARVRKARETHCPGRPPGHRSQLPVLDKFSSSRLPPPCLRHVPPDRQARGCPIRSTLVVEPVESHQALWIEVFLWIRIDLLVRRNRLTAQRALFTTNSGADLRLERRPRRWARKYAAVAKQHRAAGLKIEPIRPLPLAHAPERSREHGTLLRIGPWDTRSGLRGAAPGLHSWSARRPDPPRERSSSSAEWHHHRHSAGTNQKTLVTRDSPNSYCSPDAQANLWVAFRRASG